MAVPVGSTLPPPDAEPPVRSAAPAIVADETLTIFPFPQITEAATPDRMVIGPDSLGQ